MGDPIIDPLDLEPTKWYCVTVEIWQPAGPPWQCNDFNPGNQSCCGTGQSIINFINNGDTCTLAHRFCPGPANQCERMTGLKGPYDNLGDCLGDCP